MTEGKLALAKNGKTVQVIFTSKNGKVLPLTIAEAELSADLKKIQLEKADQLEGLEVEFDNIGGQPKKVRKKGGSFESTAPQHKAGHTDHGGGHRQQQGPHIPSRPLEGKFHNPYNFIPALPRDDINGELGDKSPAGHHRFHEELWSGRITASLKTETPLLLPDTAEVYEDDENGHKTYPVRVGPDGKPYIASTSIKGMLRAAYEAVTNSRMAVFSKSNKDRLVYRMDASEGLSLIPARVEGDELVLMFGTTEKIPEKIGNGRWGIPGNMMYAAWLPRYRQRGATPVTYQGGGLPQHGEEVFALVKQEPHKRGFRYWRVLKIEKNQNQISRQGNGTKIIHGYVCVTNLNINNKHDERVFFVDSRNPQSKGGKNRVPLTDDHKRAWKELITNYQEIHEDERNRGMTRPPALRNYCRWSRHIEGPKAERELSDGTLCYAYVKETGGRFQVQALYPVMIARKLFEKSPLDIFSKSLQPAESTEELSPADRVFGWVNQNGSGAYRGNVRISPVRCETEDAIEDFDADGLPLAIMGEPKPQQVRFYAAMNKNGKPFDLADKEKAYADDGGIRGRKVYPHHGGLPVGYWANPTEDMTEQNRNGHFLEYRRLQYIRNGVDETRNNQNRSIRGWVKEKTDFRFDLDVTNMSSVELGALLWLLELPKNHFHRLGGGKPLGFGSVRLAIQKAELSKGSQWKDFYSALDTERASSPDFKSTVTAFRDAVINAYDAENINNDITTIPFIAAFLTACKGFADNKPIHYPRAGQAAQGGPVPPRPEGEAFKWFVLNEKPENRYFLRALVTKEGDDLKEDEGLPALS